MIERPHTSFPFRRDPRTGKVAVVEQDSREHVDSCCQVIIRCPSGFRPERPEFGWPFPEFVNMPIDRQSVVRALRSLEPRIEQVQLEQWVDAVEAGVYHISIDVESR